MSDDSAVDLFINSIIAIVALLLLYFVCALFFDFNIENSKGFLIFTRVVVVIAFLITLSYMGACFSFNNKETHTVNIIFNCNYILILLWLFIHNKIIILHFSAFLWKGNIFFLVCGVLFLIGKSIFFPKKYYLLSFRYNYSEAGGYFYKTRMAFQFNASYPMESAEALIAKKYGKEFLNYTYKVSYTNDYLVNEPIPSNFICEKEDEPFHSDPDGYIQNWDYLVMSISEDIKIIAPPQETVSSVV